MTEILIAAELWEGAAAAASYGESLARYWNAQPVWMYTGGKKLPSRQPDEGLRTAFRQKDWAVVNGRLQEKFQLTEKKRKLEEVTEKSLQKPWETIAEAIEPGKLVVAPWGSAASGPWPLLEAGKGPVLLVPETATFSEPKHLVYATDFEEKDARIPAWLEQLSREKNLVLSGLHVTTQGTGWGLVASPPKLRQAFRLELQPSNIFFYAIQHKDVAVALKTFVTGFQSDWLCITFKRGRKLPWMRMGKVLNDLLGEVQIPLLVLPDTWENAVAEAAE